MRRFANLAAKAENTPDPNCTELITTPGNAPSRIGRKAISGYFSLELSMALHPCSRRHDLSLQAIMAEAFNDVLRKYGESPIGD